MLGAILILVFIIGAGFLGYFIFTSIFNLFFPPDKNDFTPPTYIDKSIHHYYHDNRTLNITDKDNKLHTINKKANP
mgnify:CR=1 FL=1